MDIPTSADILIIGGGVMGAISLHAGREIWFCSKKNLSSDRVPLGGAQAEFVTNSQQRSM